MLAGSLTAPFFFSDSGSVSLFFDDDQELFGRGMIGLNGNHGEVQGTDVFSR